MARLGTQRLRPGSGIQLLAFSPDGSKLACWSGAYFDHNALTIWDTKDGRLLRRVDLPKAQAKLLRWLPDGRGVAVLRLGEDQYYTWDFAAPAAPLPPTNTNRVGEICGLAVSSDGRWLATGRSAQTNENQPIELWELGVNSSLKELKHKTLGELPGHGYQLAFTSDSGTLYAVARTQEPNQIAVPPGGGPIPVIQGQLSEHARLARFDVATGREEAGGEIPAPAGGSFLSIDPYAESFLLAATGQGGVTVHEDGTVRIWNHDFSQEVRTWKVEPHTPAANRPFFSLRRAALANGGKTLFTIDLQDGVRRWDLQTGKELPMAQRVSAWPQLVAISPNGKWVAVGNSIGEIRFYDASTGEENLVLPGHHSPVDQIHIPRGDRTAMSAASDGTIRKWDLATGRDTGRVVLDAPSPSWPTAFTEDGRGLIGRSFWGAPGRAVS
ncbi:MAG TPA: WD40 repeat domain-containing protein, partial [Gemmataceae bacterium]|nr:WD40 repeat domain-containing protein [Gemmataceae bacterium]